MHVAIDYDDTYTRDPEAWNQVILILIAAGHTVWCVSLRNERVMKEVRDTVGQYVGEDACFGTNNVSKRSYMYVQEGIYIDVWIDDSPEFIANNALRPNPPTEILQTDAVSTLIMPNEKHVFDPLDVYTRG